METEYNKHICSKKQQYYNLQMILATEKTIQIMGLVLVVHVDTVFTAYHRLVAE